MITVLCKNQFQTVSRLDHDASVKYICETVLLCILFANVVVLMEGTKEGVTAEFECWGRFFTE